MNLLRPLLVCLALLVAVSHGISQEKKGVEGSLVIEKVEPPLADDVKAAQKAVRETYAAEIKAAKNVQAKRGLAATMAQAAVESESDDASKYALGLEAAELYVSVGDALSAFQVVDDLALTYAIPVVATKSAYLKKATKEAKVPAQKRMAALMGLKLAGDAVKDEAYDVAKELAAMSLSLAKPSRDASVIQRATDLAAKYADAQKFWLTVVAAREKLKTDPQDSEANEIVGRYLCFTRQDWAQGLPFLKLAFDQELKTVSALDLTASGDGEATVSAQAVADAWWDVAEHRKKERELILPRSVHWLERAIPELTGLPKSNAEKRLQAALEAINGRSFAKLLAEPANGVQATESMDCGDYMHPGTMQKNFDIRKSWMLALQFNVPDHQRGPHVIFSWADDRAGRDPIMMGFNDAVFYCSVDDCAAARRQALILAMTPDSLGKWIDVKLVHDSVSQELELYVNHRLVQKDPLAISLSIDRPMPVYFGGVDGGGQRFVGSLRNVWLGNIK